MRHTQSQRRWSGWCGPRRRQAKAHAHSADTKAPRCAHARPADIGRYNSCARASRQASAAYHWGHRALRASRSRPARMQAARQLPTPESLQHRASRTTMPQTEWHKLRLAPLPPGRPASVRGAAASALPGVERTTRGRGQRPAREATSEQSPRSVQGRVRAIGQWGAHGHGHAGGRRERARHGGRQGRATMKARRARRSSPRRRRNRR